MVEKLAELLEQRFDTPAEQTRRGVHRVIIVLAAAIFVLISTLVVAFDEILVGQTSISALEIGDIAPEDIHAPAKKEYKSIVLTEQERQGARESTPLVYDRPDTSVARQQAQLARRILDYVENVRRDPYATTQQQAADIDQITALNLTENVIQNILAFDDDTWRAIDTEIEIVLERVMRDSIRESDLEAKLGQLPNQVSVVRFNDRELEVIVDIVEDLVRVNQFGDFDATEQAREEAASKVPDQFRVFERGQIVVEGGAVIDAAAFEALEQLELFKPPDRRLQEVARALLASIIVMVIVGLFVSRFKPELIHDDPRFLTLLAAIFLLTLFGVRAFGLGGDQVYLFPTAAMALLYVTIIGPEVAIIGVWGLAVLVGLMTDNSLEIATMIAAGGFIGTLTLRRAERVNAIFVAGLMVSAVNVAVIAVFNLTTSTSAQDADLARLVPMGLLNGVLAAVVALGGLYFVTLLFNLPTSLKLVELSRPSQLLLQRLLREAPGTYQHSLQVANLSEQAANAIGADADLVHVAALYHDIGKMSNPAFFAENQSYIGNPHDALSDPYRSADIIVSHVTDGDEMAKQYRLPNRIRDFIREHHGTTQVFYFYQQAVVQANGEEMAVDISEFTYPGPRPQSRETAIMMLADGSESATRARKPGSKQEIVEIVHQIIEDRRTNGQLDESGLTLNDLKTIGSIFVEMLQAVFHPRIDYREAATKTRKSDTKPKPAPAKPATEPKTPKVITSELQAAGGDAKRKTAETTAVSSEMTQVPAETNKAPVVEDNEDAPLPEVPHLPRATEKRVDKTDANGKPKSGEATREAQEPDSKSDK